MRFHAKYFVEVKSATGRLEFVRWFAPSHEGLEAAITCAREAKSAVKCRGRPVRPVQLPARLGNRVGGSRKKLIFFVDFFSDSVTLFSVMGMMKSLFMELSCEELFELNAWCDERREADIAAQDADMVAEELARQSDAQLAEDAALDLMIAAG